MNNDLHKRGGYYTDQLPTLGLMGLGGGLLGWLLSAKKKKMQGMLGLGAITPALYLAYLYSRKNNYIGKSDKPNAFDTFVNNKINTPVNSYVGSWFSSSAQTPAGDNRTTETPAPAPTTQPKTKPESKPTSEEKPETKPETPSKPEPESK